MSSKRLSAVITIGGAVAASLKGALGSTRTNLTQIGGAIRNLEREQRGLGKSMREALQNGRPVAQLHEKYRAVTAEIAKARREQDKFNRAHSGMAAGRSKMGGALGGMAAVGATIATAGLPVIAAASFETAMLGVAKQVDGARDKNGKLTATYYEMERAIQKLGREIPVRTNELAGMAEAGARMGVAKKDLIEFTRTTAIMGTALQLPREQLTEDMGKIANLYKMPIADMRRLGDTINYLDDQSVAKGGDIIDFLRRTGGAAGQVKVTGSAMAALGSTLLSLGEAPETASTATNAFIQKLAAADKGSKKFRRALDEIGLSAEQVQKGMQVDAQGTILQVIDAVNKLPAEKRLGALVDLVGLEHSDTLAKLTGGVAEYRKQIEMANSPKAQGSMGREFAATLATTNAQWEITKNRTMEVAVNIGSVLLPVVNQAMGVFGRATSALADFARAHPVLVKNTLLTMGATFGAVRSIQLFRLALVRIPIAFQMLRIAMLTNPIGLILTALAVAAVLIWQNWEPIKAFFIKLWGGITDAAGRAWSFIRDYILPFTPLGPIVQNWGPVKEFFGVLWNGIKWVAGVAWDFLKTVFAWSPLGMVINNWTPLSKFFSNLWSGIKSIVGSAIDWIMGKIAAVGEAWNATKRFFGFEAKEPFAPSNMWKLERGEGSPTRPVPPAIPPARGAMRPRVLTDNRSSSYTIQQRPGEDGKALARRVADLIQANDRLPVLAA